MLVSNLDKTIAKFATPVLAAIGVLMVAIFFVVIKSSTQENNGYIRVINCVISIPAKTRTQSDIENCYSKVEKDLGLKLQRYDTGRFQN